MQPDSRDILPVLEHLPGKFLALFTQWAGTKENVDLAQMELLRPVNNAQ